MLLFSATGLSATGCGWLSASDGSSASSDGASVRNGEGKTRDLLASYATRANKWHQKHGRSPGSAAEWEEAVGGELRDAWGNLVVVEKTALVSLGSDGEPGGTGAASDIRKGLK